MTRALMVVPAGLVENWRRELNEVFNLDKLWHIENVKRTVTHTADKKVHVM